MSKEFKVRQEFVDWKELDSIYSLCRYAGVSFSLHYCEPEDSFYFVIESAAESERFVGRDTDFDHAVMNVKEHLGRVTGLKTNPT